VRGRGLGVVTKTIGIVAHSAEGGALCFLTACREGQKRMGPHMHPEIVVSCVPMGLSMPGWESDDHADVAEHLLKGVEQVAASGADFFVCPDNTAHIVLERVSDRFPLPGLHIADVVAGEMEKHGWKAAGLLGTNWTMTGTIYPRALHRRGLGCLVPCAETRAVIDKAIFEELCQGITKPETVSFFETAIQELGAEGADCVILGCTEIPIIVSDANSSLPVLDSTHPLAREAVLEAMRDGGPEPGCSWLSRKA
jgi:aspartate racemase